MNLETSARDVPVWVLTSTPPRPATVAGTATPCKYRCLGCHQTYILNILFSKSKGVDGQRPCLYMTTSLKRVVKYHRKKVLVVIYVFLFYVCVIVIFFYCFSLRHVGDLGNMLQSAQGVASTQFRDEVISLQGQGSILGRSLVVRLYPPPTHTHIDPIPSNKCRISTYGLNSLPS